MLISFADIGACMVSLKIGWKFYYFGQIDTGHKIDWVFQGHPVNRKFYLTHKKYGEQVLTMGVPFDPIGAIHS